MQTLSGVLAIYLTFFVGDAIAGRIKITKTRILDGIAYSFVEGLDGVIVGRRFEPYEGNIVIPNSVEIDGQDRAVLGIFSNAFCCSPHLESIDIQCQIKALCEDQFYKCYNLKSVKLPKSLIRIGEYAFFHCHKLLDIQIPEETKFINEGAFAFCYQLPGINIPPNLSHLGGRTFENCYGLKEICLPNGIQEIREECFSNCVGLEKVIFGEGVQVIEEKAFFNCQSLESPALPYSLTSIKDKAFQNCSLVQELSFPPDLKFIGWDAFSDCNCLSSLTFLGKKPPSMGTDAFYYRKDSCARKISVNAPEGTEKKYKSALRWKMHDSIYDVKGVAEADQNSETGES